MTGAPYTTAFPKEAYSKWAVARHVPALHVVKQNGGKLDEDDVDKAREAMDVWFELRPVIQEIIIQSAPRNEMIFADRDPMLGFVRQLESWYDEIDGYTNLFFGLAGELGSVDNNLFADFVIGLQEMIRALTPLKGVPLSFEDKVASVGALYNAMMVHSKNQDVTDAGGEKVKKQGFPLHIYGMVEEMFNAVTEK